MGDLENLADRDFDVDDLQIALAAPTRRVVRRPVLGTFGPSGRSDHDSDLGYDQAHES